MHTSRRQWLSLSIALCGIAIAAMPLVMLNSGPRRGEVFRQSVAVDGPTFIAANAAESTVWVKISIPLKPLAAKLDSLLPRSISYGVTDEAKGNGRDHEVQGFKIFDAFAPKEVLLNETHFNYRDRHPDVTGNNDADIGAQYYVERSPLILESSDTSLVLTTEAKAKAKFAKRNAVAFFWGFASFGFGEPWNAHSGKASLRLSTTLGPREDYHIAANTTIVATPVGNSLRVSSGGFLNIEVMSSDKVGGEVNKVLAQAARDVDQAISQMSVRDKALDAWRALSQPIRLTNGLYLNPTPKRFQAAPAAVENGNLILRFGVVASTEINEVAKAAAVSDLPPLEVVPAIDRSVNLNLGVTVSTATLQHLAQTLRGRTFQVGGARVTLADVKVSLIQNRILIELRKAAVKKEDGTEDVVDITLTTSPQIVMRDDHYFFMPSATVEKCEMSDSPVANWLAKQAGIDGAKVVQEQLAQFMKIDVTDQVRGFLPASTSIADGIVLDISHAIFEVGNVKTDDRAQVLKAQVTAAGHAQVTMTKVAEWLTIPVDQRLGTQGGNGGAKFDLVAAWPAAISGVEIALRDGRANRSIVQAIGIVDTLQDCKRVGRMDDRIEKVSLAEGEFITGLDVKTSGPLSLVVEMIVVTNKRSTHPFGAGDATKPWVSLRAPEGHEVVGFHGGMGLALDRIGLIVRKR